MTGATFEKSTTVVDGVSMAYVDEGEGDPIVFLHGNPTSSYLWRNVIPHVLPHGRCIAPDLVGMGDSGKLPDADASSYTFVEHRRYLDGLLEALGVNQDVTLVVHDWGSALGFDWANRHRDAVAGIAYMEAIVRPLRWDEWPTASRGFFEALRSAAGEEMVLDKNLFVEAVLPKSVIRPLTDVEMAEYRRPFTQPGETRRPTLTWPRQIPLDGEPADVCDIVAGYAGWLSTSDIPKLLVVADPGVILTGAQLEYCRRWPNQHEITVSGHHFVQEDSPDEIGSAIAGMGDEPLRFGGAMAYSWVYDDRAVDWGELSNLYRIAPLGEKPPDALATVFGNSMFVCFAYEDAVLVAAGRVLADGVDCAYIADVAVHPDHQGRGLGQAVIGALVERSRHHKKILLYANPGTETFYARFGFLRMNTAMAIWRDPAPAIRSGVLSEDL